MMPSMNKFQLVDESAMNGRAYMTQSGAIKRGNDELDDSSDSDSTDKQHFQVPNTDGPKPGKKTKGRVKIKMEFIDNKLRRYTTFSKRKTGIMKKAYELSTLTGTQVMLLVASETGHVYTFATRKLQPMITSDSGKALIQTCLNSPDPPPTTPSQQKAVDQRMNPTGFEETELSYAVGDEDGQRPESPDANLPKNYSTNCSLSQHQQQLGKQSHSNTPSPAPKSAMISIEPQPAHQPLQTQAFSFITQSSAITTSSPSVAKANPNISMQLAAAGGITVLPSSALTAGTPLTFSSLGSQGSVGGQQQAFYRIPTQQGQAVVALPGVAQQSPSSKAESLGTITLSSSQPNVTVVSAGSSGSAPPGTVMYQTPQGVVYAAPSSALPEGYILNLPQTPTLQVSSSDASGGQQFITIPVSLASAQMLQPILQSAIEAQKKPHK